MLHRVLLAEDLQPIRLCIGNDTTYFATFKEALTKANKAPEATITLMDDVRFDGQATSLSVQTHLTVDLNGFSLGDTLSSSPGTQSLFYLNRDTVTLHITSSRPGGRIWVARDYNGSIYAISSNKGQIQADHITIDVHNTAPSTSSNAVVTGAGIWIKSRLEMHDCEVYLRSNGGAIGVSTTGDSLTAAQILVTNSHFHLNCGKNGYGVSCFSNSKVEDCTISIQQNGSTAYGINVKAYDAKMLRRDTAQILRNRVQVTAQQNAYGVYCKGHAFLKNDSVFAQTVLSGSHGLYSASDTARLTARNCFFSAEAGTSSSNGTYIQKGMMAAEDCCFRSISRSENATQVTSSNTRGVNASAGAHVSLRRCSIEAKGLHPAYSKSVYGIAVNATSTVSVHDCHVEVECAEDARGLNCPGNASSSAQLELMNSIVNVRATKSVYGINGCTTSQISSCRIQAQAQDASCYGIYLNHYPDTTTQEPARASITDSRICASALKQAYGLYVRGGAILEKDTLDAQTIYETCYGIYTQNDSADFTLSQCRITSEAGLNRAYGAYFYSGRIQADHCSFSGVSRMDTCLEVMSESYARGILSYIGTTVSLDHCTSFASSPRSTARGVYSIYAERETHFRLTNCTLIAEGAENTTGLRSSGNNTSSSDIELNGCSITATGQTKTYAAWFAGKGSITDSYMDATSKGPEAYSVYTNSYIDTLLVRDCHLKAKATEKNFVVNKNLSAQGKLFFHAGYYSESSYLRMYCPSDTCSIYPLYSGSEYNAGYRFVIRDKTHPDAIIARVYESGTNKLAGDFKTIADALKYVEKKTSKQYSILLVGDCRLPAGTYVVPNHVSLVVSYKEGQTDAIGHFAKQSTKSNYSTPAPYVQLELMDGAHLFIDGVLEAGAEQKCTEYICGVLSGEFGYGLITLAPQASITIRDQGQLFAWGYITGSGEIIAESGAAVSEYIQLGKWKGGSVTLEMINNPYKVFPLSHFFYQNIECPITYHAGSRAFGSTMIKVGELSFARNEIRIIGDSSALFVMAYTAAITTLIRKQYDPLTDRIRWTTQGEVKMDELRIELASGFGNYSIISSNYVLPISTNMDMEIQNGRLTILHDVTLHPGALVRIAPEAEVIIPEEVRLFAYDIEDYETYQDYIDCWVPYSPDWTESPRDTVSRSAHVEVAGRIAVHGALYTTPHGAEIAGTDEAEGQILFLPGASPTYRIYQLTGTYYDHYYHYETTPSAMLRNADGGYTLTEKALPGESFYYRDGAWINPDASHEGVDTPENESQPRILIEGQTIYILDASGHKFSLLGARVG